MEFRDIGTDKESVLTSDPNFKVKGYSNSTSLTLDHFQSSTILDLPTCSSSPAL